MEFCFKILTLFAIITSAAEIATGLKIDEEAPAPRALSHILALFAIIIPNTFINILSHGA